MSSNGATPGRYPRQPILYADQLWKQQRIFAGLLVALGVGMTAYLLYMHVLNKSANLIWLLYAPTGLALGGAFLFYKWRSYVEARDEGLKVSTLRSNIVVGYDTIRGVKVQPLKLAFQDKRSRMVAPMMKSLMERPALFVRLRTPEDETAVIRKRLGARVYFEDTIVLPIRDADAMAWEISSRLPERVGQNQGGGKRRKRRR